MTIFKSVLFKCVLCLLVIAAVAGALLSSLNDLLYVSDAERTMRAIRKIYGEEKQSEKILDENDAEIDYDFGNISKIYKIENDLLFYATGYEGYKNGTVSLWIKTVSEDENFKIDKVVLGNSEKQTLMSKLTGDFYKDFVTDDIEILYEEEKYFGAKADAKNPNPVTGATYSATAACNAVNCVIKYLGEFGGEK